MIGAGSSAACGSIRLRQQRLKASSGRRARRASRRRSEHHRAAQARTRRPRFRARSATPHARCRASSDCGVDRARTRTAAKVKRRKWRRHAAAPLIDADQVRQFDFPAGFLQRFAHAASTRDSFGLQMPGRLVEDQFAAHVLLDDEGSARRARTIGGNRHIRPPDGLGFIVAD